MKLLILFAVVVVFAFLALGIAQYLYEKEKHPTDDDIWDAVINEFEHREDGKRR